VITHNIKVTTGEVLDSLQPLPGKSQSLKTKVILIVLVFGFISIFQIGSSYRWLDLYTRTFFENPLDSVVVLLPAVLLPIAVVYFMLGKRIGWILFAGFLTYSSVWALRILASSFNWPRSDMDGFDSLFPQPSITAQVLSLVFYLGTLYMISQADFRNQYNLTRTTAFKVFGVSWFLTFAVIFLRS
jgi:hypothetical protein